MVRSQSLALELNHDLDESALSVELKVRKKKVLLYLTVLGSYFSYKMRHAIATELLGYGRRESDRDAAEFMD